MSGILNVRIPMEVEEDDDAYIEEILEDGTKIERKVDKVGVVSDPGVFYSNHLVHQPGFPRPYRYPKPRFQICALNTQ